MDIDRGPGRCQFQGNRFSDSTRRPRDDGAFPGEFSECGLCVGRHGVSLQEFQSWARSDHVPRDRGEPMATRTCRLYTTVGLVPGDRVQIVGRALPTFSHPRSSTTHHFFRSPASRTIARQPSGRNAAWCSNTGERWWAVPTLQNGPPYSPGQRLREGRRRCRDQWVYLASSSNSSSKSSSRSPSQPSPWTWPCSISSGVASRISTTFTS